MVKITTRALKIGVQSRFYPISTVGFRTFFPENFGQAYCSGVAYENSTFEFGTPVNFQLVQNPNAAASASILNPGRMTRSDLRKKVGNYS